MGNAIKNNPEFTDGGGATETEVLVDEELVAEVQAPEAEESETAPEAEAIAEQPETEEQVAEAETPELSPELQSLVEKGRRVQAWETKMPGFDVDKIVPEFTRRSQALKALERVVMSKQETTDSPLPPEEMQVLEQALQRLGVPTRADLSKSAQETQKEEFLAAHPEYLPENDPGDRNWSRLMAAFNEYNWQAHPTRTYEFLARAHESVDNGPLSPTRGERVQKAIQRRAASAGLATVGGGASAPSAPAKAQARGFTDAQREAYRRGGWSDAEIAELEGS